ERRPAELVETGDLRLRERLEREIRERRPAPERERLAQLARARLGVRAARLRDEPLEPCEVELVLLHPEHVARRPRDQAVRPEEPAELGDGVLERRAGRLRGALAPELVEQRVGRDDLARVQEEDPEEGALAP